MTDNTDTATGRHGPFWDAVEGRTPVPPAAATLGAEVLQADTEAGTVEMAFAARQSFTNPHGEVLGAFLAAMLFDTVGPALLATLGPEEFQSTAQLNVVFLRAVRPGRLLATGRIVQRSGDLALLEATLTTEAGTPVATATAVAQVTPRPSAPGAPVTAVPPVIPHRGQPQRRRHD